MITISFHDEEVERTATSLFIYIFNLLQDNQTWVDLIQHLSSLPEEKRNLSDTSAYWLVNIFPDFYFISHTVKDAFSLFVCGSANGTTKKYFGFSINILGGDRSWFINLDDSLFFKFSRKAKSFAKSIRKITTQFNVKSYFIINGKREFWDSMRS
jgi:hypothetical protein